MQKVRDTMLGLKMLGMKYVMVYNNFDIMASEDYFDAKRYAKLTVFGKTGEVEEFLQQVTGGEFSKHIDIEKWLEEHPE